MIGAMRRLRSLIPWRLRMWSWVFWIALGIAAPFLVPMLVKR